MHVGKTNQRRQYFIPEGKENCDSDLEKDLGVWVDSSLKYTDHINHAVNNASQILGLIRRSFRHIDLQSTKQLFTALVRPRDILVTNTKLK